MNPIEKVLHNQSVLILDGAFATELERRGCNLNDSLWNTSENSGEKTTFP
jgi:homocysteine S-methyltransferase